jgi:hypothetical protein
MSNPLTPMEAVICAYHINAAIARCPRAVELRDMAVMAAYRHGDIATGVQLVNEAATLAWESDPTLADDSAERDDIVTMLALQVEAIIADLRSKPAVDQAFN